MKNLVPENFCSSFSVAPIDSPYLIFSEFSKPSRANLWMKKLSAEYSLLSGQRGTIQQAKERLISRSFSKCLNLDPSDSSLSPVTPVSFASPAALFNASSLKIS